MGLPLGDFLSYGESLFFLAASDEVEMLPEFRMICDCRRTENVIAKLADLRKKSGEVCRIISGRGSRRRLCPAAMSRASRMRRTEVGIFYGTEWGRRGSIKEWGGADSNETGGSREF